MVEEEIYQLSVMVVDDEVQIRDSLVGKIKECTENSIITTAGNGQEAMEKIKIYRPHILFTDIRMPYMNGLDLAKYIREQYPKVVVVIISGYSDFDFAQKAITYGVFNYLLKPVEMQQLRDVIEEIIGKIKISKWGNQRNILISNDQIFMTGRFYGIFHFCFNNLITDYIDQDLLTFYRKTLEKIDWTQVMKTLEEGVDWMVIDDYYVNQKTLLISSLKKEYTLTEMYKHIYNGLKKQVSKLKINGCYHTHWVEQHEIWVYTQRLKRLMQHLITPFSAHQYILEKDEQSTYKDYLYTIYLKINQQLKPRILEGRYEAAINEAVEIFHYMVEEKIGQRQLEKVLLNILQVYEQHHTAYDSMLSEAYQSALFKSLNRAQGDKEVEKHFLKCLNYISQQKIDYSVRTMRQGIGSEVLKQQIIYYVDHNFTTISSVEEVADKFNYNYAYLSRLFKKITGSTLNKYITMKKIHAAQEIIKQNRSINLSEVGQMVGYMDQHYFSRIFKLVTGESPSQFREGH